MAKTIKVLKDVAVKEEAMQIVKLLASGKTITQISETMDCNKRTMEGKISAIKDKFSANTLPHLVAFFIRKGLIK